MKTEALCSTANREVYYHEFESQLLRLGEDPAVYKWELEQALEKADPSLDKPAKEVLLTRQFMKGLPNNMKIKLLQDDPTPNLERMLSFVRRYRAVQGHILSNNSINTGSCHNATGQTVGTDRHGERNGRKATPFGRSRYINNYQRSVPSQ